MVVVLGVASDKQGKEGGFGRREEAALLTVLRDA